MLLCSGQALQLLSLCGMYRSGHALFFLSLKEESPFSLDEASANNSDPVTRNLLTKVRKPKERELPIKRKPTGCQELQNTRACTASELWSMPFSIQAWNALLERRFYALIILKELPWGRTVTFFSRNTAQSQRPLELCSLEGSFKVLALKACCPSEFSEGGGVGVGSVLYKIPMTRSYP